MERNLKTIEACFEYTGRDINALPNALAQSTLSEEDRLRLIIVEQFETIIKAINKEENGGKEWIPRYDIYEEKWWVWTRVQADKDNPGGFALSYSVTYYDITFTNLGSRLCFKSKSGATYSFETFPELYLKYRLK